MAEAGPAPGGERACPLLSPLEEAVWFGMLHAHTVLARAIDAELTRVHRLPLTGFEVLMHAQRAGERGIGMSGLARRIVLSPSGLSRLVDRLEEEGLLRRLAGREDARAVFVAITEAGARRLAEAAATHVAVLRERLLSGLDEAEMRQLAALWRRVAGEEACADPDEA